MSMKVFLNIQRRAEREPDKVKIQESFVELGAMSLFLESENHQIIYGRRGTGKTHILSFFESKMKNKSEVSIMIDMRLLSSTNDYEKSQISPSIRAKHIIRDFINQLYECLYDELSDDLRQETVTSKMAIHSSGGSISGIATEIKKIAKKLNSNNKKLWLLIDEWSSLPLDLQPYFADLIKKIFIPIPGVVLKIAAMEHRSRFAISRGDSLIGMEVGADISADVNLDDILPTEPRDMISTQSFFKDLLYKHYMVNLDSTGSAEKLIKSADELVSKFFLSQRAFEEFVRASEGVPRDAINIICLAATLHLRSQKFDAKFSNDDITKAARSWYESDKKNQIELNDSAFAKNAELLLEWIIEEVIRGRKARCFLLKKGTSDKYIDFLFGARVLHILKKNISGWDAGVRYDVYKIDYGCYVDLKRTKNDPHHLLGDVSTGYIDDLEQLDVPETDYRAIRRAVLELDEFYTQGKSKSLHRQEKSKQKKRAHRNNCVEQISLFDTDNFS